MVSGRLFARRPVQCSAHGRRTIEERLKLRSDTLLCHWTQWFFCTLWPKKHVEVFNEYKDVAFRILRAWGFAGPCRESALKLYTLKTYKPYKPYKTRMPYKPSKPWALEAVSTCKPL